MTVIAGRYRLLDVLAEGATGTVWRALDETNRHEVALKEFRAPAGLPADEVLLLYARREREARAAARISHPAVVRILGVATEDGRPWVVSELVRGLSLAETLEAAGPLPPREAARVGAEVLAALRAAREAGVPHRGVGPEHVLLANDGRIVVTGFDTGQGGDPGPEAELRSLGALLGAAASALPSADHRAGALRALIEGLSRREDAPEAPAGTDPERAPTAGTDRERLPTAGADPRRGPTAGADPERPLRASADPQQPLTVNQVERELRRIATGRARPAQSGTSTPTAGEPSRREGGGDDNRAAGGGSSTTPPPGASPSHGSRAASARRRTSSPRRGHVLLAGSIGALLIAGALTYHAVREDERGAGPGPSGVTNTAPAGAGATDGAGGGSATPRS